MLAQTERKNKINCSVNKTAKHKRVDNKTKHNTNRKQASEEVNEITECLTNLPKHLPTCDVRWGGDTCTHTCLPSRLQEATGEAAGTYAGLWWRVAHLAASRHSLTYLATVFCLLLLVLVVYYSSSCWMLVQFLFLPFFCGGLVHDADVSSFDCYCYFVFLFPSLQRGHLGSNIYLSVFLLRLPLSYWYMLPFLVSFYLYFLYYIFLDSVYLVSPLFTSLFSVQFFLY